MNRDQESINDIEETTADERLRAALTAAYPASVASTQLHARVEELAAPYVERNRSQTTRWKSQAAIIWRCAGTMAVVVLVYMGLTMKSPGHSTAAFAQVERAMREIKTAHWVRKHIETMADGSLVYAADCDVWVRLNPPSKAVRSLPQTFRMAPTESHNTHYVIDRRGQAIYNATTGEYTINPNAVPRGLVYKGKEVPVDDLLRGMILSDVLSPAQNRPSKIGNMTIPAWTSERVTVDGQPLIKFYREYAPAYNEGRKLEFTVWADPQTKRVVRSEFRETSPGAKGWERLTVNEQYRYDEEPPKGTFDLTPPPGARVKVMSRPTWAESPQKLSRAELQQAQKIIDRSETAWRRGDFEAFAAVWDFNYSHKLVGFGIAPAGRARRLAWKQWVDSQRGRWSRWESRIDVESARQFISDASQLKPQKIEQVKPDILTFEVTSRGAWAEDGDTWKDRKTTYFLRRGKDGFHIVNWRIISTWNELFSTHEANNRRP